MENNKIKYKSIFGENSNTDFFFFNSLFPNLIVHKLPPIQELDEVLDVIFPSRFLYIYIQVYVRIELYRRGTFSEPSC